MFSVHGSTKGPCSSDEKDEHPCGVHLLNKNGDRDSEGTQGLLAKVASTRSAQRKPKSSAFPSSLTWDSDSEKETQDGEHSVVSLSKCMQMEGHG